MAKSKRTAASYVAESLNTTVNPFEGLTKQQMKDKYDQEIRKSGKSAKELKKIANQMQNALKRSVKNSTTKQQQTTTTSTKQQQITNTTKRTEPPASNQEVKRDSPKNGKSGTSGKLRPSNPPSPTVRRKGSTTGATVDPRERSLRKNLQESKSRKRSTVKGRKNIAAQVKEASGSSKRNQKLVEARRRRAREEALKKNLREMFGSKYNN